MRCHRPSRMPPDNAKAPKAIYHLPSDNALQPVTKVFYGYLLATIVRAVGQFLSTGSLYDKVFEWFTLTQPLSHRVEGALPNDHAFPTSTQSMKRVPLALCQPVSRIMNASLDATSRLSIAAPMRQR
jgi:hypothetical protein